MKLVLRIQKQLETGPGTAAWVILIERESKQERTTSFSFIHPSRLPVSPLLGELNQESAGKEKCGLHSPNPGITKQSTGRWVWSRTTIVLLLTAPRFSAYMVYNIYIYLYESLPVTC